MNILDPEDRWPMRRPIQIVYGSSQTLALRIDKVGWNRHESEHFDILISRMDFCIFNGLRSLCILSQISNRPTTFSMNSLFCISGNVLLENYQSQASSEPILLIPS